MCYPPSCVVVSGLSCAGSSSLGRALARHLHLRFFSLGDYVRSAVVAAEDTTLEKAYTDGGLLTQGEIQRNIDNVQFQVAKEGSVVIDSKLGLYLLRGIYELGIWLFATPQIRARRLSDRTGLPVE